MLNPHKIHIDVLRQDDLIMTLNEFHFIRRAFNKLIYIFFNLKRNIKFKRAKIIEFLRIKLIK